MANFHEIHIEKDFWDDFIVEAFEHIDEIETNAMSLERNPEDMDIIHTMFRAFHTIKGLSGFVEHTIIQELAHKTETMMDMCRKGELSVNTKIVDAILKTSDFIKQLCESIEAYKEDGIIERIEAHLTVLEGLSDPDGTAEEVSNDSAPAQAPSPVEAECANVQINETTEPDIVVEGTSVEEEIAPETITEEKLAAEQAVIEESSSEEEDEWAEIARRAQAVQEEISRSFVFDREEGVNDPTSAKEEHSTEEKNDSTPAGTEEVSDTPAEEESVEVVTAEVVEETKEAAPETIAQEEPVEQAAEAVAQETPVDTVVHQSEVVFETKQSEEVPAEEKKQEKSLERSIFEQNLIKKLEGQKEETSKETVQVKGASASEEYMKVANYRIDHLVDMISELIINQSLIEQYVFAKYSEDRQLITNMSGFMRITRELQNLSMSLRMVSMKPTYQKLNRVARDTIQELHKDIEFVTSGEGTEIDRVVADKLLDPLVHMIKNAISHGIEEDPQDRINAGKPKRARVELNAYSKRGKIFIEVKDDGRGINTEVVYKKALEKGMIDPNKTYSDAEIREFIMMPGFSTAKVVDNISGRGVGMDVVKTQILKTGGKVDIQSALYKGSTFTLEVPVNHAIMNGTIIEMNEQQFVVPTVNVKEFLQPTEDQWISTKMQRTMIKVRDNIIPIVPLSVFFEGAKDAKNTPLVMIVELDQELRAVPITNVINRQEVVVKPVGEEFNHLKFISGMSILGTGKVSLILDIDYMFRKEVKE